VLTFTLNRSIYFESFIPGLLIPSVDLSLDNPQVHTVEAVAEVVTGPHERVVANGHLQLHLEPIVSALHWLLSCFLLSLMDHVIQSLNKARFLPMESHQVDIKLFPSNTECTAMSHWLKVTLFVLGFSIIAFAVLAKISIDGIS
jgi:hypothetical protein